MQKEDSDSEKSEGEEDEGEKRVMSRLGHYLKQFGLTPFSSSVAIGYLRSQLKLEGGQERFSRVMTWLLSKLNVPKKKSSAGVVDSLDSEVNHSLNGGGELEGEGEGAGKRNWQKGCPNLIPGLRAREFWDTDDPSLPWVKVGDLEEARSLGGWGLVGKSTVRLTNPNPLRA